MRRFPQRSTSIFRELSSRLQADEALEACQKAIELEAFFKRGELATPIGG